MTVFINLIGGPGCGKSLIAALIFAELKLRGYTIEFVQELPKSLVWRKQFDVLDNQYWVSSEVDKVFAGIDGCVDFVVTDGPLVHGLYYNRANKSNVSNLEKTAELIKNSIAKYENVNILVKRGEFPYEQEGRIQTYSEALAADFSIQQILEAEGYPFREFLSDPKKVRQLVDEILEKSG